MYWKRAKQLGGTLRFRLTVLYAGMFAGMTIIAFLVLYYGVKRELDTARDEELSREMLEWEVIFHRSGHTALENELHGETEALGAARVFCRLFGPDRVVLMSSDLSAWPHLPPLSNAILKAQRPYTQLKWLQLSANKRPVRVVTYKAADGYIYQMGMSTAESHDAMIMVLRVSIAATIGMTALASCVSYLVLRRALRGLEHLTTGVAAASDAGFSQELTVDGFGTEIADLTAAFNTMQGRVRALIRELGDVTNNFAHDLRSPLTRIRGAADTTLAKPHSLDEADRALERIIEESDTLSAMISTILSIAQADSRVVDHTHDLVDLGAVSAKAVELFACVAEDAGLSLSLETVGQAPIVRGNSPELERVLSNLLDNAVKFTPAGGSIVVRVSREGAVATLQVADSGIGISSDDQVLVFEKFFRCDSSRGTPGYGLGLSYVDAVVRAHRGNVMIESTGEHGTVFTIQLPAGDRRG